MPNKTKKKAPRIPILNLYRVRVAVLLAQEYEYVVEAESDIHAGELASEGKTVEETYVRDVGVRERCALEVTEKLPPPDKWKRQDNNESARQGWAIFTSGNEDTDDPRICRDDETGAFENDEAAWRFVWRLARYGNELAKNALAFVERHNPEHYAEVKEEGELDE
jgi:hypothetical protein